jgi:hypothetical protein
MRTTSQFPLKKPSAGQVIATGVSGTIGIHVKILEVEHLRRPSKIPIGSGEQQ